MSGRLVVPGRLRTLVAVVLGTTALVIGLLSGAALAATSTAATPAATTPAATTPAATTPAATSTATTPATTTGTTVAPNAVNSPSFGLGNAAENTISTPQTVSTPVTSTTSTSSGSLSGTDAILIAVIVIGLLVAIALFVLRDARAATVGDPDVSDDPFASKRKGSKAPPKSRKLKPAERKRRKRGTAPRKRWK